MLESYLASVLSPAMSSVSPFYAFQVTDFVGKAVTIFLFIGSICVWTIMVEKVVYLTRMIKASLVFRKSFKDSKYIISLFADGRKDISPLGDMYDKASEELLGYYKVASKDSSMINRGEKIKFTVTQIETIRSILEQSVSDRIIKLEERMSFLATAVSVSPLLGLFGTVWGVMMAFIAMAIGGKADIASMAPGISGALITTVTGLIVAIPSSIGYNYLTKYIKQLVVYMDNFTEEYISRLKIEHSE